MANDRIKNFVIHCCAKDISVPKIYQYMKEDNIIKEEYRFISNLKIYTFVFQYSFHILPGIFISRKKMPYLILYDFFTTHIHTYLHHYIFLYFYKTHIFYINLSFRNHFMLTILCLVSGARKKIFHLISKIH